MTTLPNSRAPLLRFLTVQALLDGDLLRILAHAARDTERRILRTRGAVEGARLTQLLADLREIQHDMWIAGVGPAIGSRLREAVEAADRAAETLDEFLTHAVGERRAGILTGAFRRGLKRGLELDRSRVPHTLSARVFRNAALFSGKIERIIRSSVIRGQSAREMAQQVRHLIDPRVKGGASYAALRLGRTELNNSFHRQQIANGQRDWVTGVRWNLSKSHPKPDSCDAYADHDEGLGRGVWDKSRVPDKPHPQCMCYMTYQMMSSDQVLQLIVAEAI